MFPKMVGNDSFIREIQFTGRIFTAQEALQHGVVSGVYPDDTALKTAPMKLAVAISQKSPTAILGIKTMLNYTKDHSIDDSFKFGLTWNAMAIQWNLSFPTWG